MLKRRIEIACGILLMMIVPRAIAETTLTDAYSMAGQVQPIIGEKMPNGQWRAAQSKLTVGMERIAGSKSKGLGAFSVIVDASQLGGSVPPKCSRRLSVAWTELTKTFDASTTLPRSESDGRGGEWQKLSWEQDGCKVTLLTDYPANYGPTEEGLDLMMKKYPGLRFDRGARIKHGRLTLASEGQAMQIEFVALQKDLQVQTRN